MQTAIFLCSMIYIANKMVQINLLLKKKNRSNAQSNSPCIITHTDRFECYIHESLLYFEQNVDFEITMEQSGVCS